MGKFKDKMIEDRRKEVPEPPSIPAAAKPNAAPIADFRHITRESGEKVTLIQFAKLDRRGAPVKYLPGERIDRRGRMVSDPGSGSNLVGGDPIYLPGYLTEKEALNIIFGRK